MDGTAILARTTVGDRILLHLRTFVRFDDAVDCPLDVTQPGVARGLAISRAHAALELKRQMTVGKVAVRLAHIRGFRHRRKVYTLTLAGHRRVAALLQQVRGRQYVVHFPDGDRRELPGTDALAMLQSSGLREAEALLRLLETDAVRVDGEAPCPAPVRLIGRARERAAIAEFLVRGHGLLWVTGPPGIGKTALVATALGEGRVASVWVRCRRGDAREAVIRRIAQALEARRRPALSQCVERYEFGPEALEVLDRDARGLTLVLDDADRAPDAIAFARQSARQWRAIVITADPQLVPGEREILLSPLCADEVRGFLEATPVVNRDAVAEAAEGIPARLVLARLDPNGPTRLDALLREIDDRGRAALHLACVFDPPFPAEAQRSSYPSLRALARRGLVLSTPEGFEVPGIVRERVLSGLDRGSVYGLHSRAAAYFAEDSNVLRETVHLLAADRPHEAAARLVSNRTRLLGDGVPHALLALLEECARRGADPESVRALRMEAALAAGYEKTAISLAEALRHSTDPGIRLRAVLSEGRALLSCGDPVAATSSFAEAKRLSGDLEDMGSQGRAFRGLADTQRARGNPHGALELYGKAERLLAAGGESEVASEVRADRCRTALEAGEREGLEDLRTLARRPGTAGARARRHLHELVGSGRPETLGSEPTGIAAFESFSNEPSLPSPTPDAATELEPAAP